MSVSGLIQGVPASIQHCNLHAKQARQGMQNHIFTPCRPFKHADKVLPVTNWRVVIIIQAIFTPQGDLLVFPDLISMMTHVDHHLSSQISAREVWRIMIQKLPQLTYTPECMKHAIATGMGLKYEYYTNVQLKRHAKPSAPVLSSNLCK